MSQKIAADPDVGWAKSRRVVRSEPKEAKSIELQAWRTLTPWDCEETVRQSCHLSSRSVNSNASPVGVRLGREDRLDIPYVCVSSLLDAHIPLDYVLGATSARALKQISSVLRGDHALFFSEIPPDQVLLVESFRSSLYAGGATGTHVVDPRLRQVIWPTGNPADPWVALTPLQSSGLSSVISDRQKTEVLKTTADGGEVKARRTAALMIGGANTQNVGVSGQVYAMTRPLVFSGPTETKSIRASYAVHFNGHLGGLPFAVPRHETRAYAVWRRALVDGNKEKMPSTFAIRQDEADFIRKIAIASLDAASAAYALLVEHAHRFEQLTDPLLDAFLRALIDPALRTRGFKREFAQRLISGVERFTYKLGESTYIVAADDELAEHISTAEGVLR